jgi:hypothetical protein
MFSDKQTAPAKVGAVFVKIVARDIQM